jgi:hypothetical protein
LFFIACSLDDVVKTTSDDTLSRRTNLSPRVELGAASELVLLVFKQDVERGERSVTARESVKLRRRHAPFTELQLELVRFAQFAWHAARSRKLSE